MTGTLNECSSRNSTVSWAPEGFSNISSALSQKNKKYVFTLITRKKTKTIIGQSDLQCYYIKDQKPRMLTKIVTHGVTITPVSLTNTHTYTED